MITRWRAFYGEHPLHLVAMLGYLALGGYAALRILTTPSWPQILLWFAGAIVAHDLVLFPLYATVDRVLTRLGRPGRRDGAGVNYLRVPLMGVGLTFLLFFPGIIAQGAATYRDATGLTQQPFMARWLLLCAAMFIASLLVYLITTGTGRFRRRAALQAVPDKV
ncbi:MAG: hypothetical protein ACR2G2_00775 [Pseudonocardia sp.]